MRITTITGPDGKQTVIRTQQRGCLWWTVTVVCVAVVLVVPLSWPWWAALLAYSLEAWMLVAWLRRNARG